jgi:hypothetical protein
MCLSAQAGEKQIQKVVRNSPFLRELVKLDRLSDLYTTVKNIWEVSRRCHGPMSVTIKQARTL